MAGSIILEFAVLFLDFDGVLHPDEAYRRGRVPDLDHRRLPADLQHARLFMWVDILEDIVAPYPKVRIVLSTSWVSVLGFNATRARLPLSLQLRTIGATWHSHAATAWQHRSRADQILDWRPRPRSPKLHGWLAIDDLHGGDPSESWPEHRRHRLVLTDPKRGLGCARIEGSCAGGSRRFASRRDRIDNVPITRFAFRMSGSPTQSSEDIPGGVLGGACPIDVARASAGIVGRRGGDIVGVDYFEWATVGVVRGNSGLVAEGVGHGGQVAVFVTVRIDESVVGVNGGGADIVARHIDGQNLATDVIAQAPLTRLANCRRGSTKTSSGVAGALL